MGTPQLPSTEAGAMLLLSILTSTTLVMADNNNTRVEKALSVFTVVKFPNSACTSSTAGRNGTCYTSSECSANSGTASGTCASSFGVCCVFEKSCGAGTVSQNTSYFTSTSRALGGSCSLTICKCSTDVCQLEQRHGRDQPNFQCQHCGGDCSKIESREIRIVGQSSEIYGSSLSNEP